VAQATDGEYTTASGTVSLTVNAAASGIGPAGGTVSGFYGASVTVPAGALSASVDIQIARDGAGAPAMPSSGVDTAGAIYALTPHGTDFSLPATVQIPFDSTRISTDATPVIYKAEQGVRLRRFPPRSTARCFPQRLRISLGSFQGLHPSCRVWSTQ